ncbi:MAG: ABC transporter ATP-binding protein, partial [Hyphomicrobium sp.]|nr:ABC transporter ATP-binding protein [Hyphomicrobium sp.]
ALMSRPSYLLLHEPPPALAPRLVEAIFDIVRRISAEGTSIVVVEQNVNLALDVAQSGYVMETGSITLAGTAAELRSSATVQAAYL